ncbi:TPA: type VI secretion system baseplate subunit TssF [Providencia alcalifaciens]
MNKLLAYYQKELSFLKQHGKIFADRFPKIARRLGIVEGESEDPHVSRLIESFALLTSRIHQRLDDDMPEMIETLLSALVPQYTLPLPSVCIVMVSPDPFKSSLTGKNILPADTALFTRQTSSSPCQFQTVYPVTLLPLSISGASVHFDNSEHRWKLQLNFHVWPGAIVGGERIRLYLNGAHNIASTLYTLLCSEVSQLAICQGETCIYLSQEALCPVGFEYHEALLTREPRIAPAHIMILDYFWFPQKFSFIDIQLPSHFTAAGDETFTLHVQFQRTPLTEQLGILAPQINEQFFRLHCTPAVNLFLHQAEPIVLTEAMAEYPIVPDAHQRTQIDVWAIQDVFVKRQLDSGVENIAIPPLLAAGSHIHGLKEPGLRWQSVRKEVVSAGTPTYQTFIAFSEQNEKIAKPNADTVTINVLCSNHTLAHQLQYGHSEGDFESNASIAGLHITALTHPLPQILPAGQSSRHWRFLSLLSLNYQLFGSQNGAQRLIDMLTLYHMDESARKNPLLGLINDLKCEPITARLIRSDPHSLARGIGLTLTFAPEAHKEPEYFLLCNLLDRLFALYAPVNSFTRLTTRIENDELLTREWPIRAGRLSWL